MKKHIITEQIKKYNLFQKLCYLSPIIILLITLPEFLGDLKYLKEYHNPELTKLYFIIYGVAIITFGFQLTIFSRTVIKYFRRKAIKNSTFESLSGIDYYRDKLEELSPIEISYLMDLD